MPKQILTVALLQMDPAGMDVAKNLKKADRFCRQAKKRGADIALTPEMWSTGYSAYDTKDKAARARWAALAAGPDSPFIRHFRALARKLDLAIAIGNLQRWPGAPLAPRNAVSLIDRRGRLLFTYGKVHTCDFGTLEASCTPGDRFHVADLDTPAGRVKAGTMICYDREHPESARILMIKGAEIILTPNACTLEHLRLDQFKARAWENAVGVAMTNYPRPRHNGHSIAFDPEGNKLVEADESEGVWLAHFDLERLREWRAKKTLWGNTFRRPRKYAEILGRTKAPVFERKNAFGERFDWSKR